MADQKGPQSPVSRAPEEAFIVIDEGDRDATIGCIVRYASAAGANLEFPPDVVSDVRSRFSFRTSDWDDGKECLVIWRMGSLVGVEFK